MFIGFKLGLGDEMGVGMLEKEGGVEREEGIRADVFCPRKKTKADVLSTSENIKYKK